MAIAERPGNLDLAQKSHDRACRNGKLAIEHGHLPNQTDLCRSSPRWYRAAAMPARETQGTAVMLAECDVPAFVGGFPVARSR